MLGGRLISSASFSVHWTKNMEKQIQEVTKWIKWGHLTPEFGLFLLTPENPLYSAKSEEVKVNEVFKEDPFWAIYWPGGQVLSRYILDHPYLVKNRRVFDLGAGSGACSLASCLSGASVVCANDVDPVALVATKCNFKANNYDSGKVIYSKDDFLFDDNLQQELIQEFDILLVGDMFFDSDLGDRVSRLARKFSSVGKMTFVGDPQRWVLNDPKASKGLQSLAKYSLPQSVRAENYGLNYGHVYYVKGIQ